MLRERVCRNPHSAFDSFTKIKSNRSEIGKHMPETFGQMSDAATPERPFRAPRESTVVSRDTHLGPIVANRLAVHEQVRIEEFAYAFGHAPESYGLASSTATILRTPGGEAYLNVYVDRSFWHIPGSIVGDEDQKPATVRWLKRMAREQRRTVAVYSVTAEEAPLFRDAGFAVNKFGEEPVIDLADVDWRGKSFEWVRRQSNFCRRQGLRVTEVISPDEQLAVADELNEVFFDDLQDRVYSNALHLLEGRFEPHALRRRRLFIARRSDANRIEGFLAASPIESGTSWAFETYRKRRDATRGTIPFLFREVIDRLKSDRVRRVSLCLVPGKGVEQDRRPCADARVRWMLGLWYGRLNVLFSAAGQNYFKSRFRPRYQDRYLCVYPRNSWRSIVSFVKTSGALRINTRNLLRKLALPRGKREHQSDVNS